MDGRSHVNPVHHVFLRLPAKTSTRCFFIFLLSQLDIEKSVFWSGRKAAFAPHYGGFSFIPIVLGIVWDDFGWQTERITW